MIINVEDKGEYLAVKAGEIARISKEFAPHVLIAGESCLLKMIHMSKLIKEIIKIIEKEIFLIKQK